MFFLLQIYVLFNQNASLVKQKNMFKHCFFCFSPLLAGIGIQGALYFWALCTKYTASKEKIKLGIQTPIIGLI